MIRVSLRLRATCPSATSNAAILSSIRNSLVDIPSQMTRTVPVICSGLWDAVNGAFAQATSDARPCGCNCCSSKLMSDPVCAGRSLETILASCGIICSSWHPCDTAANSISPCLISNVPPAIVATPLAAADECSGSTGTPQRKIPDTLLCCDALNRICSVETDASIDPELQNVGINDVFE